MKYKPANSELACSKSHSLIEAFSSFVTSMPTADLRTYIFRSYQALDTPSHNCTLLEAIRATVSSPFFFQPVSIADQHGQQSYISALGFNNPIDYLCSEAMNALPNRSVASIVSIGPGHPNHIGPTNVEIVRNAVDLVMDSERIADRMLQRVIHNNNLYFRFNVVQNWQQYVSPQGFNHSDVLAHTVAYLAEPINNHRLDQLVTVLQERPMTAASLFGSEHQMPSF